jgi:hypothetical protein
MIEPGIYVKLFKSQDPFLLADRCGKGWHFCLDSDGRGGYPLRNGEWFVKNGLIQYENYKMIMPYNLWVF